MSTRECEVNSRTSRTRNALDEIVRRIVDVANPHKIILFGSRVRGRAKPDSDYDIMVVYSGKLPCTHVSMRIHRRLIGINKAVDIHVIPPHILARFADSPALIYRDILREGRELHAA